MTTTTISALDAATTLDGTELVPVDQSGVTVRTTTGDIAALTAATSLVYTVKASAFTAAGGNRYGVDTATAVTVTLPAVSAVLAGGLAVELADVSYLAATNHITVNAVGSDNIVFGSTTASSKVVSTNGAILILIPTAANLWRAMLIASA